jgi:hypothetical protein
METQLDKARRRSNLHVSAALPIPRAYAARTLKVGRRSDNIGDSDMTDGLRFRLVMWFISAMPVLINPQ